MYEGCRLGVWGRVLVDGEKREAQAGGGGGGGGVGRGGGGGAAGGGGGGVGGGGGGEEGPRSAWGIGRVYEDRSLRGSLRMTMF